MVVIQTKDPSLKQKIVLGLSMEETRTIRNALSLFVDLMDVSEEDAQIGNQKDMNPLSGAGTQESFLDSVKKQVSEIGFMSMCEALWDSLSQLLNEVDPDENMNNG